VKWVRWLYGNGGGGPTPAFSVGGGGVNQDPKDGKPYFWYQNSLYLQLGTGQETMFRERWGLGPLGDALLPINYLGRYAEKPIWNFRNETVRAFLVDWMCWGNPTHVFSDNMCWQPAMVGHYTPGELADFWLWLTREMRKRGVTSIIGNAGAVDPNPPTPATDLCRYLATCGALDYILFEGRWLYNWSIRQADKMMAFIDAALGSGCQVILTAGHKELEYLTTARLFAEMLYKKGVYLSLFQNIVEPTVMTTAHTRRVTRLAARTLHPSETKWTRRCRQGTVVADNGAMSL